MHGVNVIVLTTVALFVAVVGAINILLLIALRDDRKERDRKMADDELEEDRKNRDTWMTDAHIAQMVQFAKDQGLTRENLNDLANAPEETSVDWKAVRDAAFPPENEQGFRGLINADGSITPLTPDTFHLGLSGWHGDAVSAYPAKLATNADYRPPMIPVELSPEETDLLFDILQSENVWSVVIAYDPIDRAIKFKINNGTWGPPMGTAQIEPLD